MFRRDQEEGTDCWTDGRPEQISVDYLTEISATVLVQSVFFAPLSCLCQAPAPLVAGRAVSRAPLPGSYRGFTFSPHFLAHLVVFLITSGFKGKPFYFLPVPTQLAPAQGERPAISKDAIAHRIRPCSEWDLQDGTSSGVF